MHGPDVIALVNKPRGMTSFRTLDALKRALGTKRVGHAGTLDSFAEGLLIAASGVYTRLLPIFLGLDKTYLAGIEFGRETDTLDPEGEVVRLAEPPGLDAIRTAIKAFEGRIEQLPPRYSALHLNGRRAHELARRGEKVELAARTVTIHSITETGWTPPLFSARIVCSKGTYIRALARDLGNACGSCAHLSSLTRLAIGEFRLEDAATPDAAVEAAAGRSLRWFIERLPGLRPVTVVRRVAERFRNGAHLDARDISTEPVEERLAVFREDDDAFLGIVDLGRDCVGYVMVAGKD